MGGTVFVTVGTTQFDALVRAVDTRDFLTTIAAQGYTSLVVQYGRGAHAPTPRCECGVRVEAYAFKSPSIQPDIRAASLVVSHAGAGSIMETLRIGRPLVVVINASLMDNHQVELAHAMAAGRHISLVENMGDLCTTIAALRPENLVALPPADMTVFRNAVDTLCADVA